VSLSGYEEAPVEDTTVMQEESVADERSPQFTNASPSGIDDTITSPGEPTRHQLSDDDDFLSSPSLAGRHSTPRMPSTATKNKKSVTAPAPPAFEDYPSPYEALKREVDGKSGRVAPNPTTPGKSALPDLTMTPQTSPFAVHTMGMPTTATKNKDTILHQGILNRTYRVAATPHTGRKQKNHGATPGTANRTRRLLDFDETLSSPLEEAPAPQLRREIFSSPMKGPRTPGVSVQTPGYKRRAREERERATGAGPGAAAEVTRGRTGGLTGRSIRAWDSDDDDDDDDLDMSPPKTIMFNLPESRLLQTPGNSSRFLNFVQI
jgi:DASH complex subunit ASK1